MTEDGESGGRRTRPNDRRRWLEADDLLLRQLIKLREPPASIARRMQRTQDAIRGRAGQLGLAVPSPLRPWRKHWGRAAREERDRASDREIGGAGEPVSAEADGERAARPHPPTRP